MREEHRQRSAQLGTSESTASSPEMFRPLWGCFLAILGICIFHIGEVQSQCWESSRCADLSSEDGVLECIKACKTDLSAESPVFPGNGHLQPLSESIRKYVMTHFRWNKFGRRNSTGNDGSNTGYKREDISSYPVFSLFPLSDQNAPGDNMEEEPLDRQENKRAYSMEHFRWGKPVGRKRRPIKVYPNGVEEESAESYPMELRRELSLELDYPEIDLDEDIEDNEVESALTKKNGNYRMHHFRWGSPPKDKRYGGFMTPERSQTPLMTLFKMPSLKTPTKRVSRDL